MGVVMEKLGPRRGRDDGDAEPRPWALVRLRVQDPGARAVRVSVGVPDRHPRHGHHAPPVPGVRSVGRPARGPEARRAGGGPGGRGGRRSRCSTSRSGRHCSSSRATRCTRAWSSARTRAPGDMDVNVTQGKEADATCGRPRRDENILLEPPREITLEYWPRVHRGRRADRGHARDHPAAQADAGGGRPQEGGSGGGPDRGRVVTRGA